ncbi:hypothetical protein M413DRAFT_6918 [Hebeloma cylindrosporum]|uniref:Uncharacterized protein n=1 Tax=Hebeloma cylindrosporum TaxID=76867 RepID=A0A0C2Z301_HEBCY|nr:hypothetical protein M413DRAFT_6918 [Hebeloma cylindrosporum h7]
MKSISGWSYHTTRDFVLSMEGMRRRRLTKPITNEQRQDLLNYIAELAKVNKVLPVAKKPKRKLRRCDIMEFTAGLLNPNLNFINNYMCIQTMAIGCFLFALGVCPSTVLEHASYAATGEVLKWKDLDWFITGWDEGLGMSIEAFILFNWMKNMRLDDSLFMQTSIKIHLFPLKASSSLPYLQAISI